MEDAETTGDRPASAAEHSEPAKHQFLSFRGKSLSPKHRVIVYDCKEKSLRLQTPDDFAKKRKSTPHCCPSTLNFASSIRSRRLRESPPSIITEPSYDICGLENGV